MSFVRRKTIWLVAALAVLLVACADVQNPLQPAEQPSASKAGPGAPAFGRFQAVHKPAGQRRASVKRAIGPAGGTLAVSGVELTIPPGALTRRTKIRLTVPKGDRLEVRFAPHGLRFARPATLTFDVSGTELSGGQEATVVYVPSGTDAAGFAEGHELLRAQITADRARTEIGHFSGYIVASGRARAF